jgi:two-component system cell cycle response regulator DivK
VICAENGRLGIELASQQSFDLILLDMQLPIMDGYSVARELRLDRDLKTIPIVAATSYAMAGDRERILAAGCDGYLEKPINPDTFVADIKRHLARSKGQEIA